MTHKFEADIYGRKLEIETGKFAQQAGGAVTVRLGDTVVLATACASTTPREDVDFLPLTVDVAEKFYAAGRLPGGFFKREARPSTDAILAARLCDRPLRPLFPSGYHNDTQIILTVLASDGETPYTTLGIIGASAALAISDIPFESTLGACVVGFWDDQLKVNPTYQELANSKLDLMVVGTADAIMMVEAGAQFVSEQTLIEALKMAQDANAQVASLIDDLRKQTGKPKREVPPISDEQKAAEEAVRSAIGQKFSLALRSKKDKQGRIAAIAKTKTEVAKKLVAHNPNHVKVALNTLEKEAVRKAILDDGLRPDGRTQHDIRDLSSEVGLLPRVHGSAVFTRGETQILNVVTLAPVGERQRLDTLGIDTEKHFIHHYNFPPYSVGEAGRFGFTSRREIGHGALAERALKPIVPDLETFPYTIRSVSEALSSNGSTSMASVCSGALALMDAGVPIKEPVAGIAMGLITGEGGKYVVLTDIQGAEDHCGDMDFKVAGTREGVTALQMDIKVGGISFDVMTEALEQAREARLKILEHMGETLGQPREEVNQYAPRVSKINIPVEKIGTLIGPGGATIRKLTEEYEVGIDVKDDGSVMISSVSSDGVKKAERAIKALFKTLELGEVFKGKIVRITHFGAFMEIAPGKDGLIHISELASERVPSVESVVSMGDMVEAMVVKVDETGRVDLSMRAVKEGIKIDPNNPPAFGRDRDRQGGVRRSSGFGGDRGGDRGRPRYRDGGSGGGGFGGDRGGDRGRPSGGGSNRRPPSPPRY